MSLPPGVIYWQLAALALSVLPQAGRLPAWLLLALTLALLWRLPALAVRLPRPHRSLRLLLLLAGMAAVYASYRSLLGPEGGVAFLLLCAALKLLEAETERDFFILAMLDFFVLATAFLFANSLALSLYVGLACVPILAALLVLQQPAERGWKQSLARAGLLALQALPLLLVLFVFFPRLPPLWSLNLSQGSGRSGLSDTMSPGDISRLSESAEVAFRVEFQGPPPAPDQRYWRALVLTYFDGRHWQQAPDISPPPPAQTAPAWLRGQAAGQPSLRYRILQEASDRPWLFALDYARSTTPKVLRSRDGGLVASTPLYSRFSYELQSWPQAQVDADGLPAWLRQQTLQLPAGNPEARRLARAWRAAHVRPERYIAAILDWFRQQGFFYTLEPPVLGENRIDDFLLRSRRGFCEHYAAAFVFLMRAGGVPARVVTGYQGGEASPGGDYWLLRQLDAHAWAEVWLEGQGWQRVDPTAAVAPERVQQGAPQLASQPAYWGGSGMAGLRYGQYRLLRSLRRMADYVNYRWTRDVLGYDVARQDGLMQKLLGDSTLWRRLAVMMTLLLTMAMLLLLWALRGERRSLHVLDRAYLRYCARWARHGLRRAPGESPAAYGERLALHLEGRRPQLAAQAREIARLYQLLRYHPASTQTAAARAWAQKRLQKLLQKRPS